MSDMLQLVVVMPNPQPDRKASTNRRLISVELSVGEGDDKLKHIGHSLTYFAGVECRPGRRQA
jgi:hypothetical protein